MAAKAVLIVYAGILIGCGEPQQPPAAKNRVTVVIPAEEPPKPPVTAFDEQKEEQEDSYFGSTYWDGLLTSVYYYPPNPDKSYPAKTHLKFDHHEDDLWLCGDQRKNFEPGSKYKLLVTFEPNAPCVTNWKIK